MNKNEKGVGGRNLFEKVSENFEKEYIRQAKC
jgi:hypothetical protein